jgi:hypothetical protein
MILWILYAWKRIFSFVFLVSTYFNIFQHISRYLNMFECAWTYLNTFRPVPTCLTISLPVYVLPVPAFWISLNIFEYIQAQNRFTAWWFQTVEDCVNKRLLITDYWLLITYCRLQITCYKSQITNHKSQVISHKSFINVSFRPQYVNDSFSKPKSWSHNLMISWSHVIIKKVSCDIYAITIETISYFNELIDQL